jgi:hypothetical protein
MTNVICFLEAAAVGIPCHAIAIELLTQLGYFFMFPGILTSRAAFTACRSGDGDVVMKLLGTGLPLSIRDEVSESVLYIGMN